MQLLKLLPVDVNVELMLTIFASQKEAFTQQEISIVRDSESREEALIMMMMPLFFTFFTKCEATKARYTQGVPQR